MSSQLLRAVADVDSTDAVCAFIVSKYVTNTRKLTICWNVCLNKKLRSADADKPARRT